MRNLLLLSLFLCQYTLAKDSFLPNSFQAVFEQHVVSEVSGKMKSSDGTIEYSYPGKLKFEVTGKNPSLFVSNQTKSWYYTPPFIKGEEGNLIVQSSERLFLSKFFDSLKHGLKSNDLYDVKIQKDQIEFEFKEKMVKRVGVKKALFENVESPQKITSLKELKNLKLIRSDSKEVKLVFKEFKDTQKFPSNHFEFTIPKNTKITEY